MRNCVVFQWEIFDEDGCFEMCNFDLAWWVKSECEEQIPYVANIIHNPRIIEAPEKSKKGKGTWVWAGDR